MEGRLLTFAGLRFDSVRFRDRDFIGFAPTATAPIPYITGSMIDHPPRDTYEAGMMGIS